MQMNKEQMENQYREISSLYDTVEELASTVESEFTKNPEEQIALIEPVISNVADAVDVLAEEFISVLESPSRVKLAKTRVEGALRKIFMALETYRKKLEEQGKNLAAGLMNIADPIVDKIRKQSEKIILIFMQLMEISLERIMHKSEMEEFKRANDRAISVLSSVGH